MVPKASIRTYYDRPVLKEPVWKWYIPAYFFTGGIAAASSMLALGGRLTGNRRLARQSRLASLAAISLSTGLLVADLGRPDRFYNMLRVLKPTSPMSVGSWLLSGFGAASAAAAGSDVLGILPRVGVLGDTAAAALGPAVATYTAVLLSDTAPPAWHEARDELPFVFAGGAAASAAGLAVALAPPQAAGAARRALLTGAAVELGALELMHRHLEPDIDRAYREGTAGRLALWSTRLTMLGAAAVAVGGRRRPVAIAGGVATLAGSALVRFAVFEAGVASTRDPAYVVGPQRRRMEARAGR
jgi:formate-dependent nitrite reductase membrane component NrfD